MDKLKKMLHWLWHNAVSFVSHSFAAFVLMIFLTAMKAVKEDTTFMKVLENWRELISPAVITILISMIIGLVLSNIRQRNTLASFGVRLFSHHDLPETKKRDWAAICADIKSANQSHVPLLMLGATGKETFAAPTSPLFEILKTYKGDIKILLVRPRSRAFELRCKSLEMSSEAYLEQILDSIGYCKELVDKHARTVEVRLYDQIPIWKMMIMSGTIWVQHYKSKEHVDNTPMYCFQFKGENSTLFDGFKSVFDKRWKLDGSKNIDLATFVRAEWEQHCL